MSTSKYRSDKAYWSDRPGQIRRLKEVWWNVQRPPYDQTLEYRCVLQECTNAGVFNTSDPSDSIHPVPFLFAGAPDYSANSCYDSFSTAMSDSAAWGVNAAEAKQSMGMVEKRLMQLVGFAGALRKGNFSKAATVLGIGKPKGVSRSKQFADNFLEYHFGWEPAVQDIGASLKVLTGTDFGTRRIRGVGRSTPTVTGYDPGRFGRWTATWQCTTKMGALARITNESSFLANQMGLLNPLSVAWELVPYSFVADWFGNIGQVINSLTGFVGVEFLDSYTVTVYDGRFQSNYLSPDNLYASWESHKNLIIYRNPGIKGPTLMVKPFHGFSPMRGITAVSLLLQKL